LSDGSWVPRVIDAEYMPGLPEPDNLLSITSQLDNEGAKLSSDSANNLILTYPDGCHVAFDQQIRTRDNWIPSVRFRPIINAQCCFTKGKFGRKIALNEYREQLGHPNMVVTRSTAVAHGLAIRKGSTVPCKNLHINKG